MTRPCACGCRDAKGQLRSRALFRKEGNTEGGSLSERTARRRVLRVTLPGDRRSDGSASRADFLAGEEPLGIRVNGTALTMTMRTPGDDLELAAGFLVSEAVIRSPADIADIKLCDGTACGHADHNGMGRHNAVDKVVGWALLGGRLPLAGCVLLVSSRASFELVQKAILAGIPLLAQLPAGARRPGAPSESSLRADRTAERHQRTARLAIQHITTSR